MRKGRMTSTSSRRVYGRRSFHPSTAAPWCFCLSVAFAYLATSRSSAFLTSPTSIMRGEVFSRQSAILQRRTAEPSSTRVSMMNKGFGGSSKAKEVKFKYTGTTRPGVLSPRREVPDHIQKPDYAVTGVPKGQVPRFGWMIEVKTPEQIAGMRAAGRAAREVLDAAGRAVAAGVTTDAIDRLVHEETIKRGGYPSPLNYHGFPKSCCTSLNEIVCHGIPDSTVLKEGDILNIDVTVYLNGFHGDCSEMFCVGEVDDRAKALLRATYDAWQSGAAFCAPGKQYRDIGGVIEDVATARGFTTVKNFCGHGIGSVFHTNPNVLHYRNSEPNGIMKPGHTFTIEPMICEGTANNMFWPDKWTAATTDGKRTAQFEHTFLITEDGLEALTAKIDSSPRQFWETDVAA
ncbi:unnamed protein product [Phaeothamnion confervicola]